jgi:uncharacterized protein YkwD
MRVAIRALAIAMVAGLFLVPSVNAEPEIENRTTTYLPLVVSNAGASRSTMETGDVLHVLSLINQERTRVGCSSVQLSPLLGAIAQAHSDDMASRAFFSHIGSDGSTLGERLWRIGYRFRSAAENIAAGYPNAPSVVRAWMQSDGHRANILTCSFSEIGVGYASDHGSTNYAYWTLDLATP